MAQYAATTAWKSKHGEKKLKQMGQSAVAAEEIWELIINLTRGLW